MSWLTDSVGKRQGNRAIARNRSAACNEESIPETEHELKRGRKDGCRCSAARVSCLPDAIARFTHPFFGWFRRTIKCASPPISPRAAPITVPQGVQPN